MAPVLTAVTDNVHFAQTDLVNWTLVTGGSGAQAGVVLIDAGFPGSRGDVLESLGRLGFGAADVRAILLTHAHIDHFGSAIWFAAEHGTPVYCHADEVGHAKREYLEQASPWPSPHRRGGPAGSPGRWRSSARAVCTMAASPAPPH